MKVENSLLVSKMVNVNDVNHINKSSLGPSIFKNMEGLATCFENCYSILFVIWVYYELFN